MDGVMELLSGRERRRRWSVTDKVRIVAETQEPGARIGGVAARYGVCESLVFSWRRQVREGVLVAPEMAAFMPVRMFEPLQPATAAAAHPPSQALASPRPSSGLIEIELGNGRQVRVGSDVNLAALRRVLTALGG
jgi:transposase-like protein